MSETPVQESVAEQQVSRFDSIPETPDELGTRQRAGRAPAASVLARLRWAWYSLTSMRTALILLFLLALAAVPGSVLPQRRSDPTRVANYVHAHPTLAPLLSHLGGFDVYGSPWFAAVYLLLFISLAGCVIPRSRRHLAATRARPPAAPRNLARLPKSRSWTTSVGTDDALAAAQNLLRSRRFRLVRTTSTVDAEKGHLRETGNLLFHLSLLIVLVGIGVTGGLDFSGHALVVEKNGFADTRLDYDDFTSGRLVNVANLPPFSFTMDSFTAAYDRSGATRGSPNNFDARVTWQPTPTAKPRTFDIRDNHPLSTQGTNVYLGGHGYAPHFVIRDGAGHTFDETVPFLPANASTFESDGVVKLPDAKPQQLGISGVFLPTANFDPVTSQPISIFPAADHPAVVLGVFAGNLGLDSGTPQSVYTLDTSKLKLQASQLLYPGETLTLPNHLGSVTFVGYSQWVTFQITHDPGKPIALIAACFVIVGLLLSLGIRRRRVWVRASAGDAGRTVVEVGGLARTDAAGAFDAEFDRLVEALRSALPALPAEVERAQVLQGEED